MRRTALVQMTGGRVSTCRPDGRLKTCPPFPLACALFTAAFLAAGTVQAEQHWSFRPRSHPEVPAATAWVRNPVDAFVLERLNRAGLRPSPEADRRTLIRRVTFDLTGLPPRPEEIDAFVADPAPDAYERLVDRLLASPHYGERWAQHWLDVVRYAETEGFEYDRQRAGAWRFRDYVIRCLNEDRRWDRFLREQLAGDEIDPTNPEMQVAAGFHRLGPVRRNAGNQDVAASRNEVLTERTDALGAVFLGLTVGCARCHDHKFDDIPQADYYRLQAFLAASHEYDVPLASAEAQAAYKARAGNIEEEIKEIQKALETAGPGDRPRLQARLKEARRKLPPPLPSICSVRNVLAERTRVHVLKRGDPGRPGKLVGPRFPQALLEAKAPELPADTANPRTVLARWLTDPDHPLTARVLVNRVWQYHFGRGIVATPNDFGANGSPPSHPELLDWLANAFVAGGWRLKPLQRLLVLSSTYRQASRSPDARATAADPDNRLLGRFPPRRLSAEEIRDALLAISGCLNLEAGGPSVVPPVDADLVALLYDPAQWAVTPDARQHGRRSIYLLAKRNLRLPLTEVFDQPDLQTSCPRREASTHAAQALELLNGKTSNQLAAVFARRLEKECGPDHARQVERAWLLAAGRPPNDGESALALRFLADGSLKEFALALFNINAFLYVD